MHNETDFLLFFEFLQVYFNRSASLSDFGKKSE